MLDPALVEIDRHRTALGVSIRRLCDMADCSDFSWRRWMTGQRKIRPANLARLRTALRRLKLDYAGETGPAGVHEAWKATLIIAAAELKQAALALGQDVATPAARDVAVSDPNRRATADADWLAAARVRMLACWAMNGQLGFSQSDVARAIGIRKQSVAEAITKIEDSEDPVICRARDRLENEVFW